MATRKIITRTVTRETTFENFEAISIVDAGSDGFKVQGDDKGVDNASQAITIPTGIPYNAGKPDSGGNLISKLTIKAPTTGSLNASVSIIY